MLMTSKAVPLLAWSVDIGSGGGAVNDKALKRLQPQHVDRTNFTGCLRVGIQYCSRTAAKIKRPSCFHIISYHIISYHIISYHITYHIISYYIIYLYLPSDF